MMINYDDNEYDNDEDDNDDDNDDNDDDIDDDVMMMMMMMMMMMITTAMMIMMITMMIQMMMIISIIMIWKFSKYRYLLNDLTSKYRHVRFVSLSIGSLEIFRQSCDSFIQMCSDLTIDKAHTNYIITKLSTIIIRTTYYIFCMRNNKPWTNPYLLSY